MDSTTVSLLLASAILFAFYLWNAYNYWQKRGVPTAKGIIPMIGNALPFFTFRVSFMELCSDIYRKYKDCSVVGFYRMTTPMLLIRDPELVKTVLQNNFSSFHENSAQVDPKLDPLLATNPFFNNGEMWQNLRKQLSYVFSSMRLKILFESVLQVCRKFENYLDKHLKSSDKYEVELKDLFSKFTGEVVANAGLGIEGFCFENAKGVYSFQQMGKDFLEPNLRSTIAQNIVFIMPRLNRLLRISFVPERIDRFFRNTVKQVYEQRKMESTPRSDIFQLMIDLEKKKGESVNEDILMAQSFSFFLDGYETSSATLSFIGYQLAVHQDIQNKLREEVISVLSNYGGAMTYESLKDMKYMDQVINESQRLYPALGILTKCCTEEFELVGFDGVTCRVKPGTNICIPTHALHMDPKYWPNPDVFDPERFNDERKKDIEKFAFLPFGEGPRICVGMRMALLQMKMCLSTLLIKYKLELSPKTQTPLELSPYPIISTAKSGIWAYIRHR